MRHCCSFKADDVYFLKETSLYISRKLSIGFCPICKKPVAELVEIRFDGRIKRNYKVGYKANEFVLEYKDEIMYSMRECNYLRFKSKPFGWRYGVNKNVKLKGEEHIRQYAYDFYGNKELIKTL